MPKSSMLNQHTNTTMKSDHSPKPNSLINHTRADDTKPQQG